MIESVLHGVVFGLMLSLLVGPALMLLIETSITKGIRSAILFDLGVISSDILYIYLAHSFYSRIKSWVEGDNYIFFYILGGTVLILYGVYKFKTARKAIEEQGDTFVEEESSEGAVVNMDALALPAPKQDFSFLGILKLYWKGVFFNLVNPGVLIYWISIVPLADTIPSTSNDELVFFVGLLGTFFFIDVIKIFLAKKLKHMLNAKRIVVANKVFGVFLMGIGLYFFGYFIYKFIGQ